MSFDLFDRHNEVFIFTDVNFPVSFWEGGRGGGPPALTANHTIAWR